MYCRGHVNGVRVSVGWSVGIWFCRQVRMCEFLRSSECNVKF